jgi:hypothetical protein
VIPYASQVLIALSIVDLELPALVRRPRPPAVP